MSIVRDVREELRRLKHEEGKGYTKSKFLKERIGYSANKIGAALRKLEKEGAVERWGQSNGAHSWKITIDEKT